MSEQELPKIIAVDCNFLVAAQSDKTGDDNAARIKHLFSLAEKRRSKLVIPMPALAEYLVGADVAGNDWVNTLARKSTIVLAPFDLAAAHECALLDRGAFQSGDKRDGMKEPWQKVKIDRQIVAIARAVGAKLIISNDKGVRANAARAFISAKCIEDLELPESAKQLNIDLAQPK
ncbi:hypothetical protein H0A64_00235 [Alcaligenaceae bacterium]|nr:hypothetical protein [Alcaligenaceae bacterium]